MSYVITICTDPCRIFIWIFFNCYHYTLKYKSDVKRIIVRRRGDDRRALGASVASSRVSESVSIVLFIAMAVCLDDSPTSNVHSRPRCIISYSRSLSDLLHRRDGCRQLHYFYPVIIAFVRGLFIRVLCIWWRLRADKEPRNVNWTVAKDMPSSSIN